jgi:hypothetical protein
MTPVYVRLARVSKLTVAVQQDHFKPLNCTFVGPVGLEPTTYGLKVRSSAN